MKPEKQSESGSMMIEVLAVLTVLAVMTPIVYQQALKRSIEISNVNMADEMRLVKDAVGAYLTANKETIITNCGLPTNITNCTEYISLDDLDNYFFRGTNYQLSKGFPSASDIDSVDYVIQVYGKNVTYTTDGDSVTAPEVFGVLSSLTQPTDLKKGRAMKIASLIGASGGICSGSNILGSYGAWNFNSGDLPNIEDVCYENNTIVFRTDM